jgi:hypothetical protein
MGWQARLPRDKKSEFIRTCNKCGDTGKKKTFVSMSGMPLESPFVVKCKCIIKAEAEIKRLAKEKEEQVLAKEETLPSAV